jgi:peptidoglycan-N-acetylglucosamine deacetylase
MTKYWKPSIAIQASAALHVGAIAGLSVGVLWPWSLCLVLTNHAILTVAGLWPRSTLLGENIRCLPQAACDANQVAITIDDGPDPHVTPLVLDLLDSFKAKASFFCIGSAVLAYPELACEIIRRGHSIENHSYTHRHYFSLMGMSALRREISKAQDAIAQVTGYTPLYFRAPAGLRNPFLDPVLHSLNLKLVSWTRRGFDTVTNDPEKILARLGNGIAAGDILLLHDGNSAKTQADQPVVLEVLPKLLIALQSHGLHPVALNYVS